MGLYPQSPCDTECYRNYWLAKFRLPGGGYRGFEIRADRPLPNVMALVMHMASHEVITFNGINYDMPMISAAVHLLRQGYTDPLWITNRLKDLSDSIIQGRLRSWQFYREHNIPELQNIRHIDLFEVTPGVGIGLKIYMGRMHAPKMQDLPFEHSRVLSFLEMDAVNDYCGNDLEGTHMLATHKKMVERINLRRQISEDLGTDVMSKSDAQISEATIVAKLGYKPKKISIPHGYQFYYEAPSFIKFQTPQLQQVLATVLNNPFTVNDVDQVRTSANDEVFDSDGNKVKTGIIMPPEVAALNIAIGQSVYKFGIGGLHSKEKAIWHLARAGRFTLRDHDVASYYPSLILLMQMYPGAIGQAFWQIYKDVYERRLHAKAQASALAKTNPAEAERWKVIADSLKIVLNGAFGKLGNKHSILFAPELLIRTTITGQLALLMLIEQAELSGISVVSANTDGVIMKTPAAQEHIEARVIKWWEEATGLETERTDYRAVFSASVNDYIAIKPDGSVKAKGDFGESGLSPAGSPTGKNPDRDIIPEAVIAYLRDGVPLSTTIRGCTDIRKFLRIGTCAGGGYWEETGEVLGKSLRWYYGKNSTSGIRSTKLKAGQTIGNMVADTKGCVPIMDLPDMLPADVDHAYYEREAYKTLGRLGVKAA